MPGKPGSSSSCTAKAVAADSLHLRTHAVCHVLLLVLHEASSNRNSGISLHQQLRLLATKEKPVSHSPSSHPLTRLLVSPLSSPALLPRGVSDEGLTFAPATQGATELSSISRFSSPKRSHTSPSLSPSPDEGETHRPHFPVSFPRSLLTSSTTRCNTRRHTKHSREKDNDAGDSSRSRSKRSSDSSIAKTR